MIEVETGTIDVQVPWPNGRGSDVITLHVARLGGAVAYGQAEAEAIVNLLNKG
jgi:hypothetical protein